MTHERLALAALAALMLFTMPGTARAGYDPIAGGATTLTLNKRFLALAKENGVQLAGSGGVTVKGAKVRFPVTTGKLDPVEATGVVEHAGALVFRAGRRSLPLKALQLKLTRRGSPYAAKLGGGQLKLGSSAKLTSVRSGFGTTIRAANLRLSAKAATRLDKKLGLRGVFVAGLPLGSASTAVEPATVGLAPIGKAELTLDPAFAAKLGSFFVAVNPVFPAEHPGAFTLPIGGGVLAPTVPGGVLKTDGALEFIQVGGGQFFMRELEPDLGSGSVAAEYQLVLASSPPGANTAGSLLGLGAGAFSVEPAARTISDFGAPLTLDATAAQAFNEAFAKPLGRPDSFTAGETLGTISFTAQAE